MPEVKMTEQQLNYHVNNNPMTEKRPLTECAHEAPYGPMRQAGRNLFR